MTQTKQIIVTDNSCGAVIILAVEHRTDEDMEVSVFEAYERFNKENDDGIYLKESQCSWMELSDDWDTSQIYFG